ncbi:hypothetical protein HII31_11309 [Pseudocercospora fuligena]|uniref:Uncharacterized protein n=1 Tax=Pseudocercospora fuligena TaxID=685502 RepID=A0A8H6VDM8_9PEZI|nr:hypothetical protein HII31_11309 [Pseudocercospora fuligena]
MTHRHPFQQHHYQPDSSNLCLTRRSCAFAHRGSSIAFETIRRRDVGHNIFISVCTEPTRHCTARDPTARLPIMIDRLAEGHFIRNRAPLLQVSSLAIQARAHQIYFLLRTDMKSSSHSGPRTGCELDIVTPDRALLQRRCANSMIRH